jgi:insulysin
LQLKGHSRIDFDVVDTKNDNSALCCYFQAQSEGTRARVLNEMCCKIIDEPTFNQLRTVEQLGYVVFSRPLVKGDILGALVLV